MSEEKKFESMDVGEQLTEEQRDELKKQLSEHSTKLGEIFSQCWESEEFKKAFIADPKAFFEEYEIPYNKDIEYVVIDTPDKTIIHVLPYGKIKPAVKAFSDRMLKLVDDIDDDAEKQILLEGWSWQIYQNTENKCYVPLPISPEKLSPEELEMVNGGCLILAIFALFGIVAESLEAVTTTFFIAEVFDFAAAFTAVGFAIALATYMMEFTATVDFTGSLVINGTLAVDFDSQLGLKTEAPKSQTTRSSAPVGISGPDPRRRGR